MPVVVNETDQEQLKAFIERRHPEYQALLPHWNFLESTYRGGRDWFRANVFRYLKEGDKEFQARLERAYRFNHTREVVDLVNKYIFKAKIERNTTDADPVITDFWKAATLSGLTIDQFMKLAATQSSTLGRVWIFIESNKTAEVQTKADEREVGARVYAYTVKSQNILDLSYGDDGKLDWIFVRETVRDDVDPIVSTGEVKEQFRLWTRDEWLLFKIEKKGNRKRIALDSRGTHELKRVPCFPLDHLVSEDLYSAPALINDIAYLDRAVANYLSNLDAIIQDQTFSQLAMPAQATLPGEEKYDKLLEMGTKRIFLYDGEGGEPRFLSPDVKQANLLIDVINKIISEIYHTVGMAGERTKQDNSVGIDNSSGVAKAYDFERLNSLLAAKADTLDRAENEIIGLVMAWYGKTAPETDLVKYPENFDVRSLYDEFDLAMKLALVQAPDSVRREQMKAVIDKLFPRLAQDLRAAMERELLQWPPEIDPGLGGEEPTENRQGQVTAQT